MRKKLMRFILVLAVLTCVIGLGTTKAKAAEDDFTVVAGVLTAYTGEGGAVVIPDGVEEIGARAFTGNKTLESVTVPAGVKKIGQFAFLDCSSLSSVTFSSDSTLEAIEACAFYGCSSLTAVSIPKTVLTIGNSAFYKCSGLQEVSFSADSVLESIGTYAFFMTKLKSFSLPAKVTRIGESAFAYCQQLEEFTFETGSVLESIGAEAFYHDFSLQEISFPGTLKAIGAKAFGGCAHLKKVEFLGNALESLGSAAFEDVGVFEDAILKLPDDWSGRAPENAFFGNGYFSNFVTEDIYVAQIGETKYHTLAEAFAAVNEAKEPVTIVLIADSRIQYEGNYVTVQAGSDITVDMNGKNVCSVCNSGSGSALFFVSAGAKLTFRDSSEQASGTISTGAFPTWFYYQDQNYQGSYASNVVTNGGELTVESGTLNNLSNGSAAYTIDARAGSATVINGGLVKAFDGTIRVANGYYGSGKATLTMNGGTVQGYTGIWVQMVNPNANPVDINIHGGEIICRDANGIPSSYALYDQGGSGSFSVPLTYTITGGTLDASVYSFYTSCADVNISGGTFTAPVVISDEKAADKKDVDLAVSGGIFKNEVYVYRYCTADNVTDVLFTGGEIKKNLYILLYQVENETDEIQKGANILFDRDESGSVPIIDGCVYLRQSVPASVLIKAGQFGYDVMSYGEAPATGFIYGGVYSYLGYNSGEYCYWVELIAPDYIPVYNDDPETMKKYPYTVGIGRYTVLEEGSLKLVLLSDLEQPDSEVDESRFEPGSPELEAAQAIAYSINTAKNSGKLRKTADLSEAVIQYMKDLDQNESKAEFLLALAHEHGTEEVLSSLLEEAQLAYSQGKTVELDLWITTNVRVKVVGTELSDDDVTRFTLDIQPIYTLEIRSFIDSDYRSVTILTDAEWEVNTPVPITVPRPETFAVSESGKLFVIHDKKDPEKQYIYSAAYDTDDKYITFINPDGFSEFTFVQDSELDPVAHNVQTDKYYTVLVTGLSETEDGQTLELLKNLTGEGLLEIKPGTTFDLNGHTLEARAVLSFGIIEDSSDKSPSGGAYGTSYLKLDKARFLVYNTEEVKVRADAKDEQTGHEDQAIIPVWSEKDGCYCFRPIERIGQKWLTPIGTEAAPKYQFQLRALKDDDIIAMLSEGTGVELYIHLDYYDEDDVKKTADYQISRKIVQEVLDGGPLGKGINITFYGSDKITRMEVHAYLKAEMCNFKLGNTVTTSSRDN